MNKHIEATHRYFDSPKYPHNDISCQDFRKPSELPPGFFERMGKNPGEYILLWANPAIFEHFVATVGPAVTLLYLICCPKIADFSPMEALPNLRILQIRGNQKATSLWNMAHTAHLEGLVMEHFNRLHDLRDLTTAPHLKALQIRESFDQRWKVLSYAPLSHLTSLEYLDVDARPEQDGFTPLYTLKRLRWLRMPSNLLPTEDYARLAAALPDTKSLEFEGTWEWSITHATTGKLVRLVVPTGKGKREFVLDAPGGKEKAERYRAEFAVMVERFRKEMSGSD
jgi:hypothetical protein